MPSVADATSFVIAAFLAALAAGVGIRLLTGGINTRGLFHGRRRGGRAYFSPERVQLLAVTLWTAANYVTDALRVHSLPDVPPATLALLGGSHAIYLGGKAVARFAPLGTNERNG